MQTHESFNQIVWFLQSTSKETHGIADIVGPNDSRGRRQVEPTQKAQGHKMTIMFDLCQNAYQF